MSKKYFNTLNYTLANEDTTLEVEMVRKLKSSSVLAIAGSGGRSLPLAIEGVERLSYVDMAQEQIYFVQLKELTLKKLEHEEYLRFWGYAPYRDDSSRRWRQQQFYKLNLPSEAASYLEGAFDHHGWVSLLYTGKWERTFYKFSRVALLLMGRERLDRFLLFDNIEDQKNYFYGEFNQKRWRMVLRMLGNASIFNALLYKGSFVKKNIPEGHFEFYQKVFSRLFETHLVVENYFLQMCLYGRIVDQRGNLIETQKPLFDQLQGNLTHVALSPQCGNVLEILGGMSEEFDFFSFSDVPSYFSGNTEREFMQMIRPAIKSGGVVVNRYYLKICQEVNLDGFEEITPDFDDLIALEKVQVYNIKVYRKL
jgi:S-adenosylmethionine-diacylglycerol 3-amino-3-carboxypropyl transferase